MANKQTKTTTKMANAVLNSGAASMLVPPTFLSAAAGTTVVNSKGIDGRFVSKITVANFTQAIAGAALAFGKEIYDFPEGKIIVHGIAGSVTITSATETGTPTCAFGTTTGTGATATLSGTMIDEQQVITLAAISSTGTKNTLSKVGSGTTLDGSSAAKKCFMNFAQTFTATETMTIGAVISIEWSFLGDV